MYATAAHMYSKNKWLNVKYAFVSSEVFHSNYQNKLIEKEMENLAQPKVLTHKHVSQIIHESFTKTYPTFVRFHLYLL